MKNELIISILQINIEYNQKKKNLREIGKLISEHSNKPDLIILPELFATGYNQNPTEFSESMNGFIIRWMRIVAYMSNSVVCGSLVVLENDHFFNRLVWMRPNSSFEFYDKRHLFRMSKENEYYTGGYKSLIVELNGWRIKPLICYDLRFPVWSRNKNDYDLLIYIANWPSIRNFAWKTLLLARAIENIAFVVGVNRIGNDQFGLLYNGESAVISPLGTILSNFNSNQKKLENIILLKNELISIRTLFPASEDADCFNILP